MGDLDLDSFPDILLSISDGSSVSSWVYYNYACSGSSRCFGLGKRAFGDGLLKGAEYAAFFDLDENGVFDIVLGTKEGGKWKILGIYNNEQINNLSFKILTVGATGKYGDALYGVNYRFAKSVSYTSTRILGGTQLP